MPRTPVPEHRKRDERPFFSRVRVWDEDPDVASEGVYLEDQADWDGP